MLHQITLYNRTSHCLFRDEIGDGLIFVLSLIFYHRKLYRILQFAKIFLRARLRLLTLATAMLLNCWKMLQKHSFLSKFSGASAPTPALRFPGQGSTALVHDHHHGFSFLANMPNICIKKGRRLFQLDATRSY